MSLPLQFKVILWEFQLCRHHFLKVILLCLTLHSWHIPSNFVATQLWQKGSVWSKPQMNLVTQAPSITTNKKIFENYNSVGSMTFVTKGLTIVCVTQGRDKKKHFPLKIKKKKLYEKASIVQFSQIGRPTTENQPSVQQFSGWCVALISTT